MTSPIYTALFDAIDSAMDDVADMDITWQDYVRAATEAAMKACGPRELAWRACNEIGHGRCNYGSGIFGHWYAVAKSGRNSWHCSTHVGGKYISVGFHKTLEAAKAAAQSHADAAHWDNTVIGSETTT